MVRWVFYTQWVSLLAAETDVSFFSTILCLRWHLLCRSVCTNCRWQPLTTLSGLVNTMFSWWKDLNLSPKPCACVRVSVTVCVCVTAHDTFELILFLGVELPLIC